MGQRAAAVSVQCTRRLTWWRSKALETVAQEKGRKPPLMCLRPAFVGFALLDANLHGLTVVKNILAADPSYLRALDEAQIPQAIFTLCENEALTKHIAALQLVQLKACPCDIVRIARPSDCAPPVLEGQGRHCGAARVAGALGAARALVGGRGCARQTVSGSLEPRVERFGLPERFARVGLSVRFCAARALLFRLTMLLRRPELWACWRWST